MAEEYKKVIVKKNNPKSDVVFECNKPMRNMEQTNTYASVEVEVDSYLTYSITADDYQEETNTLNVSKDTLLEPVLKKEVLLTINPNPSDAIVEFEYNNEKYVQKSIKVLELETVKYTVSKKFYETVSDIVILNGDKTIDITLDEQINENTTPIIDKDGLEEPSDADIGKYEGSITDSQVNINLINDKEYRKLSKKQKSDYVRYDPFMETYLGPDIGNALNNALVDMYWALPIVSKLSPFLQNFNMAGLESFNNPMLAMISQFQPVLKAADKVGKQIEKIQKACNKVGLGALPNILTMAFKLVGMVAGLGYAMMYNPQLLLQPYQEIFKNFNIEEIKQRTIMSTIPNLQYSADMLQSRNIPEGDIKKETLDMIAEITGASQLVTECMQTLTTLQSLVEKGVSIQDGLNNAIETLATMGVNWAIGSMSGCIHDMKLNYDKIQRDLMNGDFQKSALKTLAGIQQIHDIEPKYINVHDLDTLKEMNGGTYGSSTMTHYDYTNGYEDSLKNGKNGETEEQMEARLFKYKTDMEAQGKDPTAYIDGYRMGFALGQKLLEAERNNLNTDQKQESYSKGFEDGVSYGKSVRSLATSALQTEEYTPTEDEIIAKIEELYNDEKIRVESIDPEERSGDGDNDQTTGIINPYYANGWNAGFDSYRDELYAIHTYIGDDTEGYNNGYTDANGMSKKGINGNTERDEQLFIILDEEIAEYKRRNPTEYVYFEQGIVRGANEFQALYNDGYSQGWWTAMESSEYDTPEEGAQAKIEGLQSYCNTIGLNYNTQMSLPYIQKDGRFRGWDEGWDDRYSGRTSEDYKEMYYSTNN